MSRHWCACRSAAACRPPHPLLRRPQLCAQAEMGRRCGVQVSPPAGLVYLMAWTAWLGWSKRSLRSCVQRLAPPGRVRSAWRPAAEPLDAAQCVHLAAPSLATVQEPDARRAQGPEALHQRHHPQRLPPPLPGALRALMSVAKAAAVPARAGLCAATQPRSVPQRRPATAGCDACPLCPAALLTTRMAHSCL